LAGAAVFAFSGYTFARIQAGHIGVITTGAWLPWALWALNTLATRFTWRTVGWGAACIGLALLAGHTATFIYLAMMLGAYTLMLAWHLQPNKRKRYLLMTAVMGCLGVTLTGIQLLPMLRTISSSTRLGIADYAFASRFSWPVGYLITLLVPNFFGEPVRTGYWGDGIYDEMIFYVGLLPLMLIWVAGRTRQDKQTRNHSSFWLGVAGVSILTAFGSYSIVHRLLYRFVPLFSNMRAPARAGFLFTCSAAALTAFAIHSLSHADSDERQHLLIPLTPSRVAGVLAITAVLVIGAYGLYAWGRDSNPEAGRFWHLANEIAVFGLFFSLAAGWLRRWDEPSPSRHLAIAALILILLDLWTLGSGLVKVVPAPLSGYWERVAQQTGSEAGRVLPWGLSIFEQNGALSYNVRNVFGYNPLEDENYNRFITFNPDPRARIYDLLNVTHVSATVPLALTEDDTLTLLTEVGGVFIYSRSTALPRVWMADSLESASDDTIVTLINDPSFDPLQTTIVEPGINCPYGNAGVVSINEDTEPEVIKAHVESEGGVVVFSERFAPGWEAVLDGADVPIIKADGILRAVCVPPGEHDIQLRYQPPSLLWGAVLSAISLIVTGIIMLVSTRQQNDKVS